MSVDAGDIFFLRSIPVKTNLPEEAGFTTAILSPDAPLIELLNATQVINNLAAPAAPLRVDTTPTVYANVNRVLYCVTPAASVDVALTSHSFRRGGA
ncbi:hypothetical protein PC129_g9760 [Phytophthora cactorum]|uniref:Uncharacterized protein n=1 Tax=Phytophthora cactorum TaxID=29920 RepID=A0A329SUR9_9STRA|nr:hypothetical protein PC117_g22198 [Phytophthora cactorum]KAG2921988.1 hypothetical protein PC114_g5468 [Phytophthora cactorum]KAG2977378.1 hypothetical protein PC119_g21951 [Phytophthora cactorum]KAG3219468.1 hypothetical protein PC129_g9760 [Phytophthora cactorum]KAG4053783.1 hypothetical protein PC123_g11081 [Phytophthora cactorum]